LQGYRLIKGSYEAIRGGADGSIVSRELGIRFALEQDNLAMFDVQTGKRLLSEKERANETERARAALEQEVARLRDEARRPNGARRPNNK
jgi:hypothetical protein